jgi:hypothetical protein
MLASHVYHSKIVMSLHHVLNVNHAHRVSHVNPVRT